MESNILKNKNILVTGALGKLGKKVCEKLNKNDANVIAMARLKNKGKNDYNFIEQTTDLYDCDLSNEEIFKRKLTIIKSKFNSIDGL